MFMRAPLVEAEQNGSIRIQDLTKVVMARRRLGLTEERLVRFEAGGNVAYADDRPGAFHSISAVGLTRHKVSDCEPCKARHAAGVLIAKTHRMERRLARRWLPEMRFVGF